MQLGGHGVTPFLESMPDHPGVVKVVREATESGFNFGGAWHSDSLPKTRAMLAVRLWAI